MPLPTQVSTEGQGVESGTTHTLTGVLSQTIPGYCSARPVQVTTDPELTGEIAGRCKVGNLFTRSFAGRDDASGKDCRMVVGLENCQAQEGITTFGTRRKTPAAGISFTRNNQSYRSVKDAKNNKKSTAYLPIGNFGTKSRIVQSPSLGVHQRYTARFAVA